MSKKKKDCRYESMAGKLDNFESKLSEAKERLDTVKEILEQDPEVCADIAESEKALQETLDKFMMEEYFKHATTIGEA